MGLVERFHRTLVDRIRRLKLTNGGSWCGHVEEAVKAINDAIHSTNGFSPNQLWDGSLQMRQLAHAWTVVAREYRSK